MIPSLWKPEIKDDRNPKVRPLHWKGENLSDYPSQSIRDLKELLKGFGHESK